MVENFPGLNKDRYVHSSNSISLTFLGEPPIINTYLTLWGNKPVKYWHLWAPFLIQCSPWPATANGQDSQTIKQEVRILGEAPTLREDKEDSEDKEGKGAKEAAVTTAAGRVSARM